MLTTKLPPHVLGKFWLPAIVGPHRWNDSTVSFNYISPCQNELSKCMYIPNQVHVYSLCIKNTLNKKIKMHMIKTLFISAMKSKCAIRFIKCIRVYYPKLVPKTEKNPIYSLSHCLLILANCYLKQDILQKSRLTIQYWQFFLWI